MPWPCTRPVNPGTTDLAGAAVFVVTGVCLILTKKARLATGLVFKALPPAAVMYVSIMVANPSGIANGLNYLMDTLLLSSITLALAGAARVDLRLEHPGRRSPSP